MVRNKDKSKTSFPILFSFILASLLHFWPFYPLPFQSSAGRNEKLGIQVGPWQLLSDGLPSSCFFILLRSGSSISCCFLQEKLSYLGSPQVAVPSGDVQLFQHGAAWAAAWTYALVWSFVVCQQATCFTMGCRGDLCSGSWSTSSSPSLSSVSAPWLSLTFSLTPHSHAAVLCFIKCSFLELQPPWLRDTAWAPAANAPVYVGFNHLGLFISTSLEFIIFKTYVSYPVHLL